MRDRWEMTVRLDGPRAARPKPWTWLLAAWALASCARQGAPVASAAAPAPASAGSASASASASATEPALATASAPGATPASASAAASAPAPASASSAAPPHFRGSPVSLPGGGNGWLDVPDRAGKHPAVLVIQEWWGVTDWIKENVSRFAANGYVALAVDLYRGRVAGDAGEAHELMRGLPEDRALGDMKSGLEWLAARPDVDGKRIGVVGWCMGGGYALAFAVAEPRLRAAVVNYGKLVTAPEKIGAIHASLLGDFAGLDRGIAPEDVRAFADELRSLHKDADIKIYDDAKHAFMNPNAKEAYNDADAKDAWTRIDAFFERTLGAPGKPSR